MRQAFRSYARKPVSCLQFSAGCSGGTYNHDGFSWSVLEENGRRRPRIIIFSTSVAPPSGSRRSSSLWIWPTVCRYSPCIFGSTILNTVCEYFIIYWLIITSILPTAAARKRNHVYIIITFIVYYYLSSNGRRPLAVTFHRLKLSVFDHTSAESWYIDKKINNKKTHCKRSVRWCTGAI